MAVEAVTGDIFVESAGHTVVLADAAGTASARRRGSAGGEAGDDAASVRMRDALREADFEIVGELIVTPSAPTVAARRRARGESTGAPRASVAVGAGESAVLLLEAEGGVFTWQYADTRSAAPATQRGAAGRGQLLTFTIGAPPSGAAPSPATRRGPVLDWIGEKLVSPVRAYVLRFVVSKAIDVAVQRIEGDNPTGPVVIDSLDPAAWKPRPLARTLPADRPARILLLVHGTFSSTMGSFGQLVGTRAGKALLTSAIDKYDLVLGCDHRTLADDPQANAEAMLATLTSLSPAPGTVIDAIAYSRGGLVYRVFAEQLLRSAGLDVTLGRAIFVGCTNGGTNLAEPENWADLVDVYTNAVMAAARGVALLAGSPLVPGVGFAIRTLGRFVQMLSEVAISERKLPGLAAMEPDGALVAALNARPDPARISQYYAVTSSFEPKKGLARGFSKSLGEFLVDRVTDRLFAAPNDLVVNTGAMTMFGAGTAIDAARVYSFGDTDEVYHTIYFADESVASHLSAWLGLQQQQQQQQQQQPHPQPGPPQQQQNAGPPQDGDGGGTPVKPLAPATPTLRKRRSLGRQPVGLGRPALPVGASPAAFSAKEVEGLVYPADKGRTFAMPPRLHPNGSVRGWTLAPNTEDSFKAELVGDAAESAAPAADFVEPEASARSLPPEAVEPGAPAATIAQEASAPEVVERYLAAEMEPYPPLGKPANVFVIVSPDLIQVAAHAAAQMSDAPAQIDAARRLTLELIPRRNCALVADDPGIVEIDVRAPHEITTRLRVTGIDPGEAELIVEARQGTRIVASFLLRPVFVAKDAPPLSVQQAIGPSVADESFPVLRIYEFQGLGGQITLRFDLVGDSPALAFSEAVTLDPAFNVGAYVAGVLSELEAAWDLASDSYEAFLESFSDSAVVRADALVPLAVRTALWNNRAAIAAIQIVSDEALIPWELLCISDPTGQSAARRGFLSEWGMVRWFHGVRRPPRTLGFVGANSRSVVPRYLDPALTLAGTDQEEALLAKVLPGIVPLDATSLSVRKFLSEDAESLDVLHFACHGEAADKAVLTAKLLMNGVHKADGSVIDDALSADQVKVNLRLAADTPRSLVFLNSCQTGRGGRGIAGVAGFADAFIRPKSGRGAAAFVGALWSIDTELAETFADRFYTALSSGKILVDAVHEAREACKKSGDFTWLAYTIYGHPMALAARTGT